MIDPNVSGFGQPKWLVKPKDAKEEKEPTTVGGQGGGKAEAPKLNDDDANKEIGLLFKDEPTPFEEEGGRSGIRRSGMGRALDLVENFIGTRLFGGKPAATPPTGQPDTPPTPATPDTPSNPTPVMNAPASQPPVTTNNDTPANNGSHIVYGKDGTKYEETMVTGSDGNTYTKVVVYADDGETTRGTYYKDKDGIIVEGKVTNKTGDLEFEIHSSSVTFGDQNNGNGTNPTGTPATTGEPAADPTPDGATGTGAGTGAGEGAGGASGTGVGGTFTRDDSTGTLTWTSDDGKTKIEYKNGSKVTTNYGDNGKVSSKTQEDADGTKHIYEYTNGKLTTITHEYTDGVGYVYTRNAKGEFEMTERYENKNDDNTGNSTTVSDINDLGLNQGEQRALEGNGYLERSDGTVVVKNNDGTYTVYSTNNQNKDGLSDDIINQLKELGLSDTDIVGLQINGSLTVGDNKITLKDGKLTVESVNNNNNNDNNVNNDNNNVNNNQGDGNNNSDKLTQEEYLAFSSYINNTQTGGTFTVNGETYIKNDDGSISPANDPTVRYKLGDDMTLTQVRQYDVKTTEGLGLNEIEERTLLSTKGASIETKDGRKIVNNGDGTFTVIDTRVKDNNNQENGNTLKLTDNDVMALLEQTNGEVTIGGVKYKVNSDGTLSPEGKPYEVYDVDMQGMTLTKRADNNNNNNNDINNKPPEPTKHEDSFALEGQALQDLLNGKEVTVDGVTYKYNGDGTYSATGKSGKFYYDKTTNSFKSSDSYDSEINLDPTKFSGYMEQLELQGFFTTEDGITFIGHKNKDGLWTFTINGQPDNGTRYVLYDDDKGGQSLGRIDNNSHGGYKTSDGSYIFFDKDGNPAYKETPIGEMNDVKVFIRTYVDKDGEPTGKKEYVDENGTRYNSPNVNLSEQDKYLLNNKGGGTVTLDDGTVVQNLGNGEYMVNGERCKMAQDGKTFISTENYTVTFTLRNGYTQEQVYKDGKLSSTTTTQNGKITQQITYNDNGNPAVVMNYSYDEKGNLSLSHQIEINDKGQPATEIKTDKWGGQSTTTYTYDSNGNRTGYTETNIDSDGNKGYITYDKDGNEVGAEFDVKNNKGEYVHINPNDFKDSNGNIDMQKVIAFGRANDLATTYTGSDASNFFSDMKNAIANGKFEEWWNDYKSGKKTYYSNHGASNSGGSSGGSNNTQPTGGSWTETNQYNGQRTYRTGDSTQDGIDDFFNRLRHGSGGSGMNSQNYTTGGGGGSGY